MYLTLLWPARRLRAQANRPRRSSARALAALLAFFGEEVVGDDKRLDRTPHSASPADVQGAGRGGGKVLDALLALDRFRIKGRLVLGGEGCRRGEKCCDKCDPEHDRVSSFAMR